MFDEKIDKMQNTIVDTRSIYILMLSLPRYDANHVYGNISDTYQNVCAPSPLLMCTCL